MRTLHLEGELRHRHAGRGTVLRMAGEHDAVAGVADAQVELHRPPLRNVHRHRSDARSTKAVDPLRREAHAAPAVTVETYRRRLGHDDLHLAEKAAVDVILARRRQHVQPDGIVHHYPQEVLPPVVQQAGDLELEGVVAAAMLPRMAAVHHQVGHRTGSVEADEHPLAAPRRGRFQITEIVAGPPVIIPPAHGRIRSVPRVRQIDPRRIAPVHGIELPPATDVVHFAGPRRRSRQQQGQQDEEKPFHKLLFGMNAATASGRPPQAVPRLGNLRPDAGTPAATQRGLKVAIFLLLS